MRLTATFLTVFLTMIGAGSAGALTLDVVGGRLVGASGVDVGGTLYDVSFVADASCIDAYDDCDAQTDFPFPGVDPSDTAASELAMAALLDQVFVDGPDGNFDSNPLLVLGCDALLNDRCAIVLPSFVYPATTAGVPNGDFWIKGVVASNGITESGDFLSEVGHLTDSVLPDFTVYATFSPTANVPVPLPSSFLLLLGGGMFLGRGLKRRR